MRVFVTDGENRAALAVTRSLGKAGHEVIVGERHAPALAQTSKYCAERVVYPDPVTASDSFLECLESTVRERSIDALVPVSDITTMLVTAERERFEPPCAIPFAPADIVERAADKVGLLETARRLGVPTPASIVVESPAAIPEPPFAYPLVIKPHKSRLRTASGWMSSAVSYARNRDELVLDLTSRGRHEFPVLLQERISGTGLGVFALYHKGSAVAMFSHRRVRERPPWGGVSVLSESVAMDPRVRDYATSLLNELRWQGVAMVEFKDDVRDGIPKLMEINGRFWGSLQLAIDAGVDFPALLVESAAGSAFGPQPPYRLGVRNRWLWGDFDSLLLRLFGRRRPGALRESRVQAMLEFAKFFGRDLHYDNPKPHDVGPWIYETKRRFSQVSKSNGRVFRSLAKPKTHPGVSRASLPILNLRGRIVPRLEDVGLDEEAWNTLLLQSDTRSVFQTRQWACSWLASYGQRVQPLFVTVSNRAGVQAVAPFVLEHRSGYDRVLRLLGDGRADYCDILTGSDKPAAVQSIFDALKEHHGWDVIELNNVPAYSRTPDLLRKACQRAGYHYLVSDQFVCPTLLIEGHEDSAREIFNKQSLRRRENYFQRKGRLCARDLTRAKDIEPYLDAFFAQHAARWQSCGKPSLFATEENRNFYRNLTAALDATGHLLFSVVEFDDHPIAFHYGFDYNGAVTWYKPSFDVAHAAHSPGLVMVRHLIGYALERKRRELDFTVGDEEFKRRFTNSTRRTLVVQVFREHARYLMERSKRTLAATVRHMSR